MSLINLGLEDDREDDYLESPSIDLETNELYEDAVALDTGTRFQRVMQAKVDRGEELSDEEIFIATETIGRLYSSLGSAAFEGFGFEQYADKELTQMEKSKIALEAITNQNDTKIKTLSTNIENFFNELSDFKSLFTGDLNKIKKDLQDLKRKVNSAPDEAFKQEPINDLRVTIAYHKGVGNRPFKDYKEVLKALEGSVDTFKIINGATAITSKWGGKNGKFDLTKINSLFSKRIIKSDSTKGLVTYDLNPDKIVGATINLTMPDNSDSNRLMRTIKSNFLISSEIEGRGLGNVSVKGLSKKECLELIDDALKNIYSMEDLYMEYYNSAKTGVWKSTKLGIKHIVADLVLYTPAVFLSFINLIIFKTRLNVLVMTIHNVNRKVYRGIAAHVADSID